VVHLERCYWRYKDRVTFAFVNVGETKHKIPGYEYLLEDLKGSDAATRLAEKRQKVLRARNRLGITVPVFLDSPEGSASEAYSAWPARLVLVGADGRLARDFGWLPSKRWNWDDVTGALDREPLQFSFPAETSE
jgi:hypothetical protein